jgi:hypothetical protein
LVETFQSWKEGFATDLSGTISNLKVPDGRVAT